MTDETEGKAQDSQQDAKAPGAAEGTTPPETFTKAQMDEEIAKAKQKALIAAGRETKRLKDWEENLKTQQAEHDRFRQEQEEVETEKYRDDPDGLKSLQEKRRQKKERDEIAREKAEFEAEKASHAEKLARADEVERESLILKTAYKFQIDDVEKFQEKCTKFNLTTEEQIQEMAETMSTGQTPKREQHFDSNRGIGGRNLSNLSSDEKIAEGLKKLKK